MRYAKLSCIEFYSCYLQQCLSIDLFSYRTPWGHMNKVCPSFCSEVFLELALQFFQELNMVLGTHVVLCMTEADFLKIMFCPKIGKIGQAQGSLNVQESSGFFLSSLFVLSIQSIMEVYITVILVCLKKILVPEIWSKMLLANQIVGFFNQSQDSKIGCISQRN